MVDRLVKLGGVQIQEVGVDVILGQEPTPPSPQNANIYIYRNGLRHDFTFNDEQLGSISLGIAAYDGQVGMGTMTVPGNPGWVAGDRISFKDEPLGNVLYTGFVGDWSVARNESSPTEVETTYQLMDVNRQWIGRKVVDWNMAPQDSYTRLSAWLVAFMSDLTLDLTYVDPWGGVDMPAKNYTGDGFMDLGADLILYTGKTFFMLAGQTEGTYQVHFHELTPGPIYAGIAVSDVPTDIDLVDVFPMTSPVKSMSASDLKNNLTAQNGTVVIAGTNGVSQATHDAGGLKWQAVVQYSVTENDLILLADGILDSITGTGEERPTYSFTIQHLLGNQVVRAPAGSTIGITSDIIDIGSARIAHETLTVSRDLAGRPLPGFWDVACELGYPFRGPAAVRGYGGQGGDSGALAAEFAIADHIDVIQPDLIPPVGGSVLVTGYLRSEFGAIVNNGDVEVNWTLEQWQDVAGTIPSTAWSLDDSMTLTDRFGKAVVILSHDNSGAWSWFQVHADL